MSLIVQALRKRLERCTKCAAPLLLVVMAVVVGMLALNAVSFRMNLEATREATSDNRIWTTSQLDVDYKSVLIALSEVSSHSDVATRSGLESAFDIFYSRTTVVASALKTRDLPPALKNNLAELLQRRDALAAQYDSMDASDPKAFARLAADTRALAPLVRNISLGSLEHYVSISTGLREREGMLWQRFWIISLVLIGLMGTAMGFALLLRRQLAKQFDLLQSASNKFRMVYDASMMAVVVTDLDGKIVLFNAASEKVFGTSAAAMLGRNAADTLIPPDRLEDFLSERDRLQAGDAESLYGGRPRITSMLDANRREFPIELTLHVNHDTDGKTLLIAFIRDMSKEIAHETALREARDEARRLAESRTMFLATMSHEMRTPLHGLLASLELIGETGHSAEVRKLLATARGCALRSVSQIKDVLDLVQLDQAQEAAIAFSPVKAVSDIVVELAAVAHEHNNATQIRFIGTSDGQHWVGAKRTFSAVLYNLIGNALKFTVNGSVSIDLAFRHEPEKGHRLAVAVTDTGAGISKENQAHVFDMFFTDPGSGGPVQRQGTGLGLPIARKGVENMGGQLRLESEPGKGSRFFFDIPITATSIDQAEDPGRPAGRQFQQFGLSCLVVDDNMVNLELTEQMLRQLGCNVLSRDSGAAAVSAATDAHFDVILMDLNMPGGMSGVEASRQIRALEKIDPNRRTPSWIVAVTADTTFGSSLNHTGDCIDSVLHKPFRMTDLISLLASFESRQKTAVQRDAPVPVDADFAELYDLMGPVAAKRLLAGVVADMRSLQNALATGGESLFADLLHRTVGSAGMVGLGNISTVMAEAQRKLRQNGYHDADMATVFLACDEAIERIQRFMTG